MFLKCSSSVTERCKWIFFFCESLILCKDGKMAIVSSLFSSSYCLYNVSRSQATDKTLRMKEESLGKSCQSPSYCEWQIQFTIMCYSGFLCYCILMIPRESLKEGWILYLVTFRKLWVFEHNTLMHSNSTFNKVL